MLKLWLLNSSIYVFISQNSKSIGWKLHIRREMVALECRTSLVGQRHKQVRESGNFADGFFNGRREQMQTRILKLQMANSVFFFFLPKYKKRASKKDSTSARWDGRDFFAVIGAASQGRCPRWAQCKNILIVRLNCHPKRGKLRELFEEGFKKNWVHFGQTIYELEFQT